MSSLNNVFNINKILNTNEIKVKYKYIQHFLHLHNSINNKELITIIKISYNLSSLLEHVNNLEYLIFSKLKPKEGAVNLLKELKEPNNDTELSTTQQLMLYNKLSDMIVVDKDINNPLCNCCLEEYNLDSIWYTSKSTHKEIYEKYISYGYLHICNECNIQLESKMTKYYKQLELIPFSYDLFKQQTIVFMKYQTLLFNLLFNYTIEEIKKICKESY